MFTGIIQAVGKIESVHNKGGDARIWILTGKLDMGDVQLGDSIAANCVCLTAIELKANAYCADVSGETLALTTLGDLKAQAEARKMDLSEVEVRWAELSIFKRAYAILQERKHPSKMLMCSMRISPPMNDGSQASWHIEKIAGGDVVYTCPPGYIFELMEVEDKLKPFNPEAIHEPPPKAILEKLMRLPYFVQAYEPDGMSREDFNKQGALVATAAEFAKATRTTVDFVAQQFQSLGKM